MLYSKSYIFTLKETPRDAEIISHQLMLRAGLIRKSAVGLYTWMPLGKKILDRVIAITKQEMDKAGALEILPPFVTQGELWQESGRWDKMGKELLRFKDRHGHDLVLGPTHEEAFTQIIKETAQSYQDLPVNLYQINTKFRDEIRPRYGLMRCREFIMKDAYSFDIDDAGLEKSYQAMREAYLKIFKRIGLTVDSVLADSGAIGGSGSEEFIVPSSVGEDEIVRCACRYAANVEKAESIIPVRQTKNEQVLEKIHTPNVTTIEELAHFFKCETKDLVKSFIVEADGKLVMACIRGDLQVNEIKLKNILNATEMAMADADLIFAQMKAPIGSLGAKDSPIDVIMDVSVLDMHDTIIGANEKDMHYKGVSIQRDCTITKTGHFHLAQEGHLCIHCNRVLQAYKGIEVGHIFKLGQKYTEALNVKVLDQNNKEITPTCGSYGIGIGRMIAAVIEQGADDNGIVLPFSIAPYHVIIIPTLPEGELYKKAVDIYEVLRKAKIKVLLDDRKERVGSKFKDADLIGIPIRITVGRLWQDKQEFELKIRSTGKVLSVLEKELLQKIQEIKKSPRARKLDKDMLFKAVLFFFFGFVFVNPHHAFYDMYSDIPFQYGVTFTGNVIISSKYFNYTNNNAVFNFDYTITTRSEFSEKEQIIVDWYISSLRSKNLPPILNSMWEHYLREKKKEIAYTVKLDDYFLVFDKKGKRHPIGYFFESLFPIINLTNTLYQQRYFLPLSDDSSTSDSVVLDITGWDFFKYTRPIEAEPLILLETNTQFINNIYSNYAEQKQQGNDVLFWMQNFEIENRSVYDQLLNEGVLTGMYTLDLQKRALVSSTIIGKISTRIPYQYANFEMLFTVKLEGKFDIVLKDQNQGIPSEFFEMIEQNN